MSKIETWKQIKGYESSYEVSTHGNVKSLDRVEEDSNGVLKSYKGKTLKQTVNSWGYSYVRLSKENKAKTFSVHRLVAENFIPNPKGFPHVNHKNENKVDNRIQNLEWCSCLYNNMYAGGSKKRGISKRKEVFQYDTKGNLVNKFDSAIAAEKEMESVKADLIYLCCNNRTKTHNGFVWSYKELGKSGVMRKLQSKMVGDKFQF